MPRSVPTAPIGVCTRGHVPHRSTAGVLAAFAAFAAFAVGFLARPLGGVVAGRLGDRHGRKPMPVLALTLTDPATTGIGLLPTYAAIGLAAPAPLVPLRVVQGVAVGAQWGGAMLPATEYAPGATRDLGMKKDAVFTVSLCVSLTRLLLIPAAAALSDRVGRIRVYALGAAGIALRAVPMFLLIDTGSLLWPAVPTFVAGCFPSIVYGPRAALSAESFTPQMRCTGASLGHQIAAVLGGGLAPFVMLLLEATDTSMAVSGYATALAVTALPSVKVLAGRVRSR